MKKFYKLLRASLTENMQLFNIGGNKKSSKLKKTIIPIFLFLVLGYAIGSYVYLLMEQLYPLGLGFVVLTLFMFIATIMAFMEGIYKSQGILFECKDNNLLFALPIKKSSIFAIRVIKMLLFQLIYSSLFLLPTYAVYIYYVHPSVSFYLLSLLMLLLISIIPTILSCLLGVFVKGISVKFKSKRLAQTILSFILIFILFFASFKLEDIISQVTKNATSINDFLTKLYYPIGAYISLIEKFDILTFIKLLLINILPLILVIYIGSISYFKIISKSSESNVRVAKKKVTTNKVTNQTLALVKREFGKYFSIPTYMFNTGFGLLLILILTIALCFNTNGVINAIVTSEGINVSLDTIHSILPKIYIEFIIFTGVMTSITSSSISLEGKSFNVTKSLPIKEEKIMLAKILMSVILTLPFMFISIVIFIIKFKTSIVDILLMIAYSIVIAIFSASFGLLVNLKYPKMNASSDVEIVKQSTSSMVSVFTGLFVFALSCGALYYFFKHIYLVLTIELIIMIVMDWVIFILLKTYGKKRIREINA